MTKEELRISTECRRCSHCPTIGKNGAFWAILELKTFKTNPSRTQNRGEKGLSAGGGVEVDGGYEAVAGVGIGLETSRGDQGAEATQSSSAAGTRR